MKIIISDSKNIQQSIEISQSEKIGDLKEKIKIIKGINSDIILHCNGEILEEDKTVDYYEIEENNVIVYMGTFRAGKKLLKEKMLLKVFKFINQGFN